MVVVVVVVVVEVVVVVVIIYNITINIIVIIIKQAVTVLCALFFDARFNSCFAVKQMYAERLWLVMKKFSQ